MKQVATADENGRFSYSGQLDLTYNQMVMDEEGMPVYDENGNPVIQTIRTENGMFLLLVAEDANGNRSTAESVVVTLEDHDWEADYTVDQKPTCEDEGMKSIGRVQYYYALGLVKTGRLEEADKLLNSEEGIVVDDVREGEDSIQDLWEILNHELYQDRASLPYRYTFHAN